MKLIRTWFYGDGAKLVSRYALQNNWRLIKWERVL